MSTADLEVERSIFIHLSHFVGKPLDSKIFIRLSQLTESKLDHQRRCTAPVAALHQLSSQNKVLRDGTTSDKPDLIYIDQAGDLLL
jgi:hypothetical protein